jgi:polysaccharide export outer membrane protein
VPPRDSIERSAGAPSSAYRLGPGDQIEVSVFGAEAFSGPYRVAESGEIAIPLLGPAPASGLTARELEDTLEVRLKATYMRDPHVTIQVAEMLSHGVSVVGAVNRPGVYQVPSESTLLEVLALAEGLAPDAGNTVYVIRRSAARHHLAAADSIAADAELVRSGDLVPVDLGALLESGSADQNVAIHPGDIVQVRPAGLIYVVGEVNSPGGFTIPPGRPMTVLQALAMAQGLGGSAAADRGVIVREHDDGRREELPVDLESVLKGSEPPPVLVARDVLFVPKNEARSFALGVVDALVRMISLRGLVY